MLAALALLATCTGERSIAPDSESGAALGVSMAVSAPTATAVQLRVTTAGGSAQPIELARESIAIGAGAIPPVSFAIDLAPCLGQIPGVAGCDVFVEITLMRDATVLDRQVIGPIRLIPGQSTTIAKPVTLYEISTIQITTPAGAAPRIESGDTLQLAATALDGAGTSIPGRLIIWSSSNPAVATVDQSGRVVGLTPGTTQITAVTGSQTTTITFTVAPPAVATIAFVEGSTHLDAGRPTTLTVTLRDKRGAVLTGRLITFSSSDVTRATVSPTGVVVGLTVGNVVITATSEGKSTARTFTVDPGIPVSIAISPRPSQLEQGQTVQLAAVPKDAQGNARNDLPVTWQSSAPTTASVSASGLVTAVAPGATSVRIIASAPGADGQTLADTVTLAVVPVRVVSVTVTTSTSIIEIGTTVRLVVTAIGTRGQTIVGRPISWRSSDPAAATVDSTGLVSAIAPGDITITATVDGVQGTVTLRLVPPQVASIVIGPLPAKVTQYGTIQLTATAIDTRGNPVPGVTSFIWAVSDSSVATVDNTGNVYGYYPGVATVTARYGNIVGAALVTVEDYYGCGGSQVIPARPALAPSTSKRPAKPVERRP